MVVRAKRKDISTSTVWIVFLISCSPMAFNVRQNSTFECCLYLIFGIRCYSSLCSFTGVLQFVPKSAIQHSSFQFLYSDLRFDIACFTIQLCSLKCLKRCFSLQSVRHFPRNNFQADSSLGTSMQGNDTTSILQLRRSTHNFPGELKRLTPAPRTTH